MQVEIPVPDRLSLSLAQLGDQKQVRVFPNFFFLAKSHFKIPEFDRFFHATFHCEKIEENKSCISF